MQTYIIAGYLKSYIRKDPLLSRRPSVEKSAKQETQNTAWNKKGTYS